MSYRMIHAARRLMCDKFSILCTLAELNAKQTKEDEEDGKWNYRLTTEKSSGGNGRN